MNATLGVSKNCFRRSGHGKMHPPPRGQVLGLCRTQVSKVSSKRGQVKLWEEEKSRGAKREAEDAKKHQLHGFAKSTGEAGAIKLAYNKVCTSLTKPVSFDHTFCSSCTA